ncbi:hypothetical protein SeMB42_g06832 [Synchytrium endobioticum]|uniref:Uncharacterized protein n=1 Tax=Synchytrium endobioticum TaxID=286115 RepID=A0A507CET3_9FUNG|nr:hypothetical protein SeMB42_g06832 [Synchytrium endobioticum]
MLPLLKERIVEVVGEERRLTIEYIEGWVDKSLEDDPPSPPPPVQVFYKINRLLPGHYRWSIVPHASFGDGYVTMSEECLFDLYSLTSRLSKRLCERWPICVINHGREGGDPSPSAHNLIHVKHSLFQISDKTGDRKKIMKRLNPLILLA